MDMESTAFRIPVETEDGELLGALDWSGLVARLAAERDLRRELASRIGAAGSFSQGAEQALQPPVDVSSQGQSAVNPAALGNGKAVEAITPATGAAAPAIGIEARGQQ